MGIIYNGTRYSPCGRKRKPLPKKSRRRVVVNNTKPKPNSRLEEIHAFNQKYPSYGVHSAGSSCTLENTDYKQEISSNYTIAPAYNKGAYQVILKDSVKDIGK